MNYTIIAFVISMIILSAYAVSSLVLEVEYTPKAKLEALDYIVCVNALVVAQNGGSLGKALSKGFKLAGLRVSYTIKEFVLRKDLKKLVVLVNHSYTVVVVRVELGLKVLEVEEGYGPAGFQRIYVVEVWSDRPVVLKGGVVVGQEGSTYTVRTSGRVCDLRGLCVEVP